MNINPREIHGNWRAGWALDEHTLTNGPNTHSPLGKLVYRIKPGRYRNRTQIRPIAEIAVKFIKEEMSISEHPVRPYLDAIIPVPPSKTDRDFQPVVKIAEEIGAILNVPAPSDYLIKVKETPLMKETKHTVKPQRLNGAYDISCCTQNYRCVLLFDDIFDSGATLREATQILLDKGGICNDDGKPRVFVLTLTKTRLQQ